MLSSPSTLPSPCIPCAAKETWLEGLEGFIPDYDRSWGYYDKCNNSDGERQKLCDFTLMWDIKKQSKQAKQNKKHRHKEWIGGYQRESGGFGRKAKWVKEVNCVVMNGN